MAFDLGCMAIAMAMLCGGVSLHLGRSDEVDRCNKMEVMFVLWLILAAILMK